MNLENFTDLIKKTAASATGLSGTAKFAFDEGGAVFIDATQTPYQVSNDNKDSDCTVMLSLSDAVKLLNGDLNPMTAFMFGKLKVKGDMGIAMKIAQFLAK
ncbi:MAG: sterol-binding protein [Cytophagales bacterium]|nr:MAG: sterol-binding protein [Cytophagales bacterium]